MDQGFPDLRFRSQLRPSQQDVAGIVAERLGRGQKRFYIVAPPGSGKTITGLYLWARLIRTPALVLSPNSAIQSQWVARTDLFEHDHAGAPLFSADPRAPALLTSLTYQAVTIPRRGGGGLDAEAELRWRERLVDKGEAATGEEARAWIASLHDNNPEYYEERLAAYRKEVRDQAALSGAALATLHESARAALEGLKQARVGLIIFDECHHLLGHWGRVLADAAREFSDPVVIGLTATPPDVEGKDPADVERYREFFGEGDYEAPTPAVVKDGFLAPYQDLAYFVRPEPEELAYIATADQALKQLVEDLCIRAPVPEPGAASLPDWVAQVLAERRLPSGPVKDWPSFERRDPGFALAGRLFLVSRGLPLPADVPAPEGAGVRKDPRGPSPLDLEVLVPVLDRYVRHCLRHSTHPSDHELSERVIARLRLLGVQVTETGSQACASPVSRVLAYSRSKARALVPIFRAERAALADSIRAVVISDYERTSATSAEVSGVLDEEAGGAVAAFRTLLSDPITDDLDPVLVTGSSVLVDDDLAERFGEAAAAWLSGRGLEVSFDWADHAGFRELLGRGRDWSPRVYVAMITDLFQQGLTRCLVGTRGLLGEGWDASKINVLIDLTTVTTSMTVNQLRGRSIRLDPDEPRKLANNWDVIALAPEFVKGLDDYRRFIKKHKSLFGLTDDGVIEKGVGHVHAAFTELKPEGVEDSAGLLNEDMLARAGRRAEAWAGWRIGEPYHPDPIRALEVRGGGGGGFPPFGGRGEEWTDASLALAVASAVRGALAEAGLFKAAGEIRGGERAGGYLRVFLESGDPADRDLFAEALAEALGPLKRPRYVIPRYVDVVKREWLSKILPEVLDRYVRNRKSRMAMLHAVPSALSRNKDLAAVYARHWNKHVSPGEAVYAFQGSGEDMVEGARRAGLTPRGELHDKEIFL